MNARAIELILQPVAARAARLRALHGGEFTDSQRVAHRIELQTQVGGSTGDGVGDEKEKSINADADAGLEGVEDTLPRHWTAVHIIIKALVVARREARRRNGDRGPEVSARLLCTG